MIIFVQLMAFLLSCSVLQKSTEAGRDNTPLEVSSEPSEPGTLPGTDTGGGTGTGTTVEYWTGTIRGKIDIQLYEDNASGDREMLFWEETYPDEFPFGKLFVTAYYYDQQGALRYAGYDIIENPTPSDNIYDLEIMVDTSHSAEELRVFAILDYYQDNITGSDEPKGGYPRGLVVTEELNFSDIDFAVLSPVFTERPPCETTPAGDPLTVQITGDAVLTETYTDGDVAIFVMLPGGVGPVHYTVATPEILGGGAQAPYALEVCQNIGTASLRGTWDENHNGMFDPMDAFGSYIDAPNSNGNPINIRYTDLAEYQVQVPLNGSSGLSLLPFMNISGTVNAGGSTFDSLVDGAEEYTLHVTALKFRPQREISVQEIIEEQAYDVQTYEYEDLVGRTQIDFSLTAPKETLIYLWAYIDVDGNGYVNESQEPVSSGGEDDNGKFPTGNVNLEGVEMIMSVMQ